MLRATLVAVAVILLWQAVARHAAGAPQDGSYSLALNIPQDQVASSAEFTVEVLIERGDEPPYQAVQWEVGYDPAFVDVVRMERAPGTPDQCNFTSEGTNRLLLGCIDLGGANIDYSGVAYLVTMRCVADSDIHLNLSQTGQSFVAKTVNEQGVIHTHGDTVTCGGGGPDVIATVPAPPRPGETPLRDITPPAGATQPPGSAPTTAAPGGALATAAVATATARALSAETPSSDGTATGTAEADGTRTPPAGTASQEDAGSDDGGGDAWVWIVVGVVAAAAVAAAGGGYWYMRNRSAGA